MAWWLATVKPGNTAPYLHKCTNQEDAEEREDQADSQGLTAKVYHTGTDDIFEAKRFLRGQIARDFGYNTANSNYGSVE